MVFKSRTFVHTRAHTQHLCFKISHSTPTLTNKPGPSPIKIHVELTKTTRKCGIINPILLKTKRPSAKQMPWLPLKSFCIYIRLHTVFWAIEPIWFEGPLPPSLSLPLPISLIPPSPLLSFSVPVSTSSRNGNVLGALEFPCRTSHIAQGRPTFGTKHKLNFSRVLLLTKLENHFIVFFLEFFYYCVLCCCRTKNNVIFVGKTGNFGISGPWNLSIHPH